MLGAQATELYLYACKNPNWTAQSASTDLGIRLVDIEAAVQDLQERLLLVPLHEGSDTLTANAPDVAVAELVDEDERRIHELTASVAHRRSELMALVPAFRSARTLAADGTSQVEVIEDPETVMRLLVDIGRRVSKEVIIVDPGASSSVERHEESNDKDRQLLGQGVARRTLYPDRRRDHPPTQRTVDALEPLGAEFRTLPVIPFRMLAFDQSLVIISRQRDADDRAALVIRCPDLVGVFVKIFETAWEFASPFRANDDEEEVRGLSAVQSSILSGLTMGLTDEALAARLGISLRTCRRHIATLFEMLGAESRFQAGVLAMARGWVPASVAQRVASARATV